MVQTAARRYLAERYHELTSEYQTLPNQGRALDGYHYTTEALGIFPRYNVVDAMRVGVERLDPDDLPTTPELLRALHQSADEAESVMTRPPHGEIEAGVMRDERLRFHVFLRDEAAMQALAEPVLPYRRVLTDEESHVLVGLFEARWGTQAKAWHPMISRDIPEDVVIVRDGGPADEGLTSASRRVLANAGRRRVYELREFGPEYLLDLDCFEPFYNGAEGLWGDLAADWIIFASHEGTIALGGLVADALPIEWSDLEAWRWES